MPYREAVMPVSQQIIPCPFNQWTVLCTYNENRRSLLVCIQGADAVLSITTNTPVVSTPFGNFPSGFFLSTANGTGPGIFDLSAWLDDEAVQQEWYAYTLPSTQQAGVALAAQVLYNDFATAPAVATVTFDLNVSDPGALPASVYLIVVYSVLPIGTPYTVTSAVAGVLAPQADGPLSGRPTYDGNVKVYTCVNRTGADTITATAATPGAIQVEVYAVQYGTAFDQATGNISPDTPLTISTLNPAATNQENALAAAIAFGAAFAGEPLPVGWALTPATPFSCIDSTPLEWSGATVFKAVTSAEIITAANWGLIALFRIGAIICAAEWSYSVLPSPQAAVLQSFALQEQSSQGLTFKTGLPKLSPGGVAALVDLQKRLGGQPEASNANTDTQGDV